MAFELAGELSSDRLQIRREKTLNLFHSGHYICHKWSFNWPLKHYSYWLLIQPEKDLQNGLQSGLKIGLPVVWNWP